VRYPRAHGIIGELRRNGIGEKLAADTLRPNGGMPSKPDTHELRQMRGRICEFALADPTTFEHQLTSLDNIGGFERLKIGASFRSSACNKRTPDSSFHVHRIACTSRVPLSPIGRLCMQRPSKAKARPGPRIHSYEPLNCCAASIRPCTSSPALKPRSRNSDERSEGIIRRHSLIPTRLYLCGAEFQKLKLRLFNLPESQVDSLCNFTPAAPRSCESLSLCAPRPSLCPNLPCEFSILDSDMGAFYPLTCTPSGWSTSALAISATRLL